ncbi:MAG TPA: cytochrome c biogenesis protein CcdA [Vicinamibacterales bacterium]|nr:cytochrome c biogenesis protein CcdA [Vicinamibacterales bacterium]HOQ59951.1 cytochrome c biogenesis protein CcdA [Vicinamibacterales bacterium]
MRHTRTAAFIAVVASAVSVAGAAAQLRRPEAALAPLVERPAGRAGETVRLAVKVSLAEGLHTQSNAPRDPTLIPTALSIDAPAGITVSEVVYPKAVDFRQEGQEQPLSVFEREFAIGVQVVVGPEALAGAAVPARLQYQACNDVMCFAPATAEFSWTIPPAGEGAARSGAPDPVFASIAYGSGEKPAPTSPAAGPGATAAPATSPEQAAALLAALDRFEVRGTAGGYLGTNAFLRFVRNAEAGVRERGVFEGRGPLAILVLVLLGGLALNLTPCVLPMIPINIAIIGAGAQAGSRGRGFLLGGAYGTAMALVYGLIGLVVVLTAGTFGAINASPWFNLAIAALFVALGLAMFDVFDIDFSRFGSRFRPGEGRGSLALAFTMGAVAALLAGACVAPVVIQVVLFSSNLYAAGTTVALALPFCLGLGMALPWPIVGAGIAAMPKPGRWMVRVKQAFGIFILATAAYYAYQAYGLFATRWVDPADVKASVEEQLKTGWHAALADGLDEAAREGKPVLVDFWATWCKNCLTMDKTTFEEPQVKAALAGYVKIKVQAEDLDAQPAKDLLKRFDAVGLPTYVILQPRWK